MKTTLIFGSGRFASLVCNNTNDALVGDFDVPTKLVDEARDVRLCLPSDLGRWGLYPTHQESWLCLSFIAACHASHEDESGLAIRQQAWQQIPEFQWQALAAKATEFANEFRSRLSSEDFCQRKLYKSLTRALQDCILYLVEKETFPQDQDAFLGQSPVASLIEKANLGRAGQLSQAEGLELANQVDAVVADLVEQLGGSDACRQALSRLSGMALPSRVILLPEGMSLALGSELVEFDAVIGQPDEHDMDIVSIVASLKQPTLYQLNDVLSAQRMDIIAVPPTLGPADQLTGGHPAFQSVAEMLLANGTPVTSAGHSLVDRLTGQVCPLALAGKYREVAMDFFYGDHRKSWISRRDNPSVPQVKKVIPLYRIACDLLPRAAFLSGHDRFPGGIDMAQLADEAGLGDIFVAIRSFLDQQDADQAELEAVASQIQGFLQS